MYIYEKRVRNEDFGSSMIPLSLTPEPVRLYGIPAACDVMNY